MPLSKDLREFVELLNANQVDYVVVGAFALAFHGIARYTADLDILVRPNENNAERILITLKQFGFGQLAIEIADLVTPESVVQLGVAPNRIDLLTAITGVTFDEAWASRVEGPLYGARAYFLGREALLRNKLATGRARDFGDAEELRKRTPTKPE